MKNKLPQDGKGTAIQGFSPDPSKTTEFIVGTTAAIDVSDWTLLRWNSKDGAALITRKFNSLSTGMTRLEGVDVLNESIATVTFTGTAGKVVEVEGM